jgi:hypothetical protein
MAGRGTYTLIAGSSFTAAGFLGVLLEEEEHCEVFFILEVAHRPPLGISMATICPRSSVVLQWYLEAKLLTCHQISNIT